MKALPSIAFNEFRGSAGDVTARVSQGRQVLSARTVPAKGKTPAQAVSRNRLSKISRSYKKLSDGQMKAWAALAEKMKGISTFGQAAELTPHNAFVRINTNLQMVGEPMLEDAPAYINDVPEVLYEDLWISPDMIVFTGLEQPSESHVLVFKMTSALSPGVSSGWGQTVIITPGMAPDWGDADVTALYTTVMGVAPEADKKYFCEFYWLDKKTGFTGESMAISAVCKEGSTAYNTEYVPRVQFKNDSKIVEQNNGEMEEMDFELLPGSVIVSNNTKVLYTDIVAGMSVLYKRSIKGMPRSCRVLNPSRSLEGDHRISLIENYIDYDERRGEISISSSTRGGCYGVKHYEIFSTAIAAV